MVSTLCFGSRLPLVLLTITSLASTVSAHGRISRITTDDAVYAGWDPLPAREGVAQGDLVAWSAENLGNIFVNATDYANDNITCHYNSQPGKLHAKVEAGKTIKLQWNEWPTSHKGPVLTYAAACNGSCADVDKDALQFVKIEEQGWINASDPLYEMLGGTWASDVLIANNFTWTVTIPPALEAGNYVLRHEIIALHVAEQLNMAQVYPQCVNIEVTQSGATHSIAAPTLPGRPATTFYSPTDPGIFVDIHGNRVAGYQIPGPKLWEKCSPQPQPGEKRARDAGRLLRRRRAST